MTGLELGGELGLRLGDPVGTDDGLFVTGLELGAKLGLKLGDREGFFEGELITGLAVGFTDGTLDVGELVGVEIGEFVSDVHLSIGCRKLFCGAGKQSPFTHSHIPLLLSHTFLHAK